MIVLSADHFTPRSASVKLEAVFAGVIREIFKNDKLGSLCSVRTIHNPNMSNSQIDKQGDGW